MDSGKFSSAAVNRVLKRTGANQAISRVQALQHLSYSGVIQSEISRAETDQEQGDEERAGWAGGLRTTQDFAVFCSPFFRLFPNSCGLFPRSGGVAGDRAFYTDF